MGSRYLHTQHSDLVTPDGVIAAITHLSETTAAATVVIENIPPVFVGYQIDPSLTFFNIKSTLAQLGIDGVGQNFEFDRQNQRVRVDVQLNAYGIVAKKMLACLPVGAFIGKLFAADERRRVRNPDYLYRLFGRSDRWGKPLLLLGGPHGSDELLLDKVDGRTVAYLALQNGRIVYDESVTHFLPTLAEALKTKLDTRNIIKLHQHWDAELPRKVSSDEILLVRTLPLHMRTVYGRVVNSLLAAGYHHTTASVLQPDTEASGDVYELFGTSKHEITDIPLEFYTLEPYREHVYFSDRDQLQSSLDEDQTLFKAFATAPLPETNRSAVFIVKSEQLLNLTPEDWISKELLFQDLPGATSGVRQAQAVERYIQRHPAYPFLKAIDDGYITSQGILLVRFFPSPLMKRMLLSDQVVRCMRRIYFQYPSPSFQDFFSAEDRALLNDFTRYAISVYWVDKRSNHILQYAQKPDRSSGMFVPLHQVDNFLKATIFGIYGSNLVSGDLEQELRHLLQGLLEMREEMSHSLLHPGIPISLVTGGGPGVMEVGNRVAKELGILSCANIVDFRTEEHVEEQLQNPFIEAKMTYRLDKLVERQAEFNLDFPIFLIGGVGTDFEYALEEVRRKIGATTPSPVILFGNPEYWREKITSRFRCNKNSGTIKGSEWLSNCFYCIQTAQQGLSVYRQYFKSTLPIGKNGPIYEEGFVRVGSLT